MSDGEGDLDWDAHLGDPELDAEEGMEQGWDPDSFLLAYGVPMGDRSAAGGACPRRRGETGNRRAASLGSRGGAEGRGGGWDARGNAQGTAAPYLDADSRGASASGQAPSPHEPQQEGYTVGRRPASQGQGPVVGSFRYSHTAGHQCRCRLRGATGLGFARKVNMRAMDLSFAGESETEPSHSHSQSHSHSHNHSHSHSHNHSHSHSHRSQGATTELRWAQGSPRWW